MKQTIIMTWRPPHVDANFVTNYWVYRVTGYFVDQATLLTKVLVSANPVPPNTTTVMDTDTKSNVDASWVQAQRTINNGGQPCVGTCFSGVSNFQVITR